jgi:hypothetical protein
MFEFMVLNDSDSGTTSATPVARKPAPAGGAFLTVRNGAVRYHVPSNASVTLSIVDGRGKQVAVLVDGFKSAGDYDAALPAFLSHGMYVVRLTAGAQRLASMQMKM